ncbi:MAG: ABC transporter ATP-binding protein [Treponema sp.]|jgi:iron(III) transport system ATP-binding protein|nr:ABC transporter ATP-binding protein [Treponema sp.]
MIEYRNVQINYGNFTAIEKLSLTIEEGEFFTFLGPSGCGKTTLLRSLVGFISPASGEILVDGKVINNEPVEKRGIGIVFQSYALFPSMNVFENLAFGLRVKKLPEAEIRRQVYRIAGKVAISEDQLSRNVSELSGGQQQRVALARAIVLEPRILCLDEPLSNLDAKLRVDLRGELKRLQKELGITTLYVTHDQEEALTLSDRIAVFNHGTIEQVGTPYEIYSHSATEFVCDFIGDINRLGPGILAAINAKEKRRFDTGREAFIRLEGIETHPGEHLDILLEAKVLEAEYYGALTKYTFEAAGEKIKSIEKSRGTTVCKAGDKVPLYLDSRAIMQF